MKNDFSACAVLVYVNIQEVDMEKEGKGWPTSVHHKNINK